MFLLWSLSGPSQIRVHAAVLSGGYAFSELLDLQPNDTLYVPLPFYHNHALGVSWAPVMYRGAAIAIRRKFSASRFWSDIRKFHARKFGYIGEMCQYLMNQPEKPDDAANPVEAIVGNGLRPEIWKAFKKRSGWIHRDSKGQPCRFCSAQVPEDFVGTANDRHDESHKGAVEEGRL